MRVHFYLYLERPSPELLAMKEGMERHGLKPVLLRPLRPKPCDLAVCWGVNRQRAFQSGQRTLVLERGYVGDRFNVWTAAGFDGLNGRADFCNAGKGPERWQRYHAGVLRPWRAPEGDYVLLLGQVATDAAVRRTRITEWYERTARALRERGHKVVFRPHPLAPPTGHIPGVAEVQQGTLAEALQGARWVVSFNSNASLLAVLAGVPTVTCDEGAMAWAVTGHDPLEPPPRPDRTQWANELAWTQWTQDELRSGAAWEHLRQGVEA